MAELEATTVRKGNKKVSVTLSGWVVKSMNWWDDGDIDSFVVGDKDARLGEPLRHYRQRHDRSWLVRRLQHHRRGPGQPGWLRRRRSASSSLISEWRVQQYRLEDISTLYSYIYIKSDRWGTLNWGYLSPASDNPAVLADISGTVIESNAVFFEGGGFFLRPSHSGQNGFAGLDQRLTFNNFLTCYTRWWCWRGLLRRAAACGSLRLPDLGRLQVRDVLRQRVERTDPTRVRRPAPSPISGMPPSSTRLTGTVSSFRRLMPSLGTNPTAAWPTHLRTSNSRPGFEAGNCFFVNSLDGPGLSKVTDCGESRLNQIGASILHKPSGLGIYGLWQHEEVDGGFFLQDPRQYRPACWCMMVTSFKGRAGYRRVVREAVLAEGLGVHEWGGPWLARRHHLLRRIRPL